MSCGAATRDGGTCRNPGPWCRWHNPLPAVADDGWVDRAFALPLAPACWSWPLPDGIPADRNGITLYEWHAGRCALCGLPDALVCDHDHVTGLVRGYLDQSCNLREGHDRSDGGPLALYRSRPPAVILGVELVYVTAAGAAQSAPPTAGRSVEEPPVPRGPLTPGGSPDLS